MTTDTRTQHTPGICATCTHDATDLLAALRELLCHAPACWEWPSCGHDDCRAITTSDAAIARATGEQP